MYLSQTIRKYLGWCPRTHALPLHLPVLKDNFSEDTPAQEGGIPARTGWSQRYRNQVLLMAVAFTLAAFPAVTFFQTNDPTRLMMYIGTITGLGLFAFFGRWLWNSFEMLAKGMTIQTGPGSTSFRSLSPVQSRSVSFSSSEHCSHLSHLQVLSRSPRLLRDLPSFRGTFLR